MKADRRETLRYLGYRFGQEPDDQTEQMIAEAAKQLERESMPKSVYREYDCEVTEDRVRIGGFSVTSAHLAQNLAGCERAVLLAATIGRAADLMIRRFSVTNMAKAAIVQAAGASCIEDYVDGVQEEIQKDAESRGYYLRPRFSPGYGDFPLDCQKEFFAMLECGKRIGITLTEGNLMMPSKSVTAVIGLTRNAGESCHGHDCSGCGKADCEFREVPEKQEGERE